MLLVNNLSIERSGKCLFQNLDISVPLHAIIQIKGRNGIGKTTLIKILANIIIPKTGDIYWNGKSILKNPYDYFKSLALIMDINTSKEDMTVYENIIFWKNLFLSNIHKNEIDGLLEMLNMQNNKNTMVKNLSYGEKRKLEISRLVIEKKKLWLFDEPYLGLDQKTINIVNETIRNHTKGEGMVIFTSHYQLEMRNVNIINLEDYAIN